MARLVLDLGKSLEENASDYYEKAKKMKRKIDLCFVVAIYFCSWSNLSRRVGRRDTYDACPDGGA